MDLQEKDVKLMVMTAEESRAKMEENVSMETIHLYANVLVDLWEQHARKKSTNVNPTHV